MQDKDIQINACN